MAFSSARPCSSHPSAGYGYSVCISHNGTYLFGSDCYSSKTDAQELMNYMQNCDPSQLRFELYAHRPLSNSSGFDHKYLLVEEPPIEVTDPDFIDLSHMKLTKFENGYLLSTHEMDKHWGTKNFMGGTWMPKYSAWYFSTPHAYSLLEYGVVQMEGITDEKGNYIEEDQESNYSVITISDDDEFTITDDDRPYKSLGKMKLKKYGRGYMLYPKSSHKYYGQKYLGDGFWNKSQKGWFFRSRFLNDLLNSGFKLTPPKN